MYMPWQPLFYLLDDTVANFEIDSFTCRGIAVDNGDIEQDVV